MEWVTVDKARILGAMSTSRRGLYDGWILANPDKEARVEELIANLAMEFRSGIEANPRNVLDPDPAKLPQTCVRYCEELCLFKIGLEMEATLTEGELMAASKAEIFLRYLYTGRFFITGSAGEVGGSPTYKRSAEREARVLSV